MKWALKILDALRWPEKSAIQDPVALERMQKITSRSSWIGQLLSAADQYEVGDKFEKEIAMKLVALGLRHKGFLCEATAHPPPLFGLCQMPILFPLLNGVEARIRYLRQFADELGLQNSNCVIRYRYSAGAGGATVQEYATIRPLEAGHPLTSTSGYIRREGLLGDGEGKHVRWLVVATRPQKPCKCKESCLPPTFEVRRRPVGSVSISSDLIDKKGCPCWINNGGCLIACHDCKHTSTDACTSVHSVLLRQRFGTIKSLGESCLPVHVISSAEDPRNGRLDFGVGVDFGQALIDLYQGKTSSF